MSSDRVYFFIHLHMHSRRVTHTCDVDLQFRLRLASGELGRNGGTVSAPPHKDHIEGDYGCQYCAH